MFLELLHGILDRNVVFGMLIGVESMYLLTRIHQNGSARLWLLLLPLLALSAVSGVFISRWCMMLACSYLLALLIPFIAAIGAAIMTVVHQRLNRRAHEQEAVVLFFASIAALIIWVTWQTKGSTGIPHVMGYTLQAWAGYGLGIACFTSIGVRLHPVTSVSRLGGMALFYITLALAGLTLGGVAGLSGK